MVWLEKNGKEGVEKIISKQNCRQKRYGIMQSIFSVFGSQLHDIRPSDWGVLKPNEELIRKTPIEVKDGKF
jgi:hypothetical protein